MYGELFALCDKLFALCDMLQFIESVPFLLSSQSSAPLSRSIVDFGQLCSLAQQA